MDPGTATATSLQDRFAPRTTCFGCGPANTRGLRIKSFPDGDAVVATFEAEPHHEAFPGILSGGILATVLDCHANWTAAEHLRHAAGSAGMPSTVTAELSVRFVRPTPTDGPIHLRAQIVEASDDRATVEATVEAGGRVTAVGRGTFVAVAPGHPAYGRWSG